MQVVFVVIEMFTLLAIFKISSDIREFCYPSSKSKAQLWIWYLFICNQLILDNFGISNIQIY